jgi:hypothetical protein
MDFAIIRIEDVRRLEQLIASLFRRSILSFISRFENIGED